MNRDFLDMLSALSDAGAEFLVVGAHAVAVLHAIEPADLVSDDLVFQIGLAPSRIDILTDIGSVDFEEAWQNRVTITLGDLDVPVIGRAELIQAKRDAGRPRDLADLIELEGDG